MTFTITMSTDSAAFDQPREEIARMLRQVATRLEEDSYVTAGPIRDSNGVSVGTFMYEDTSHRVSCPWVGTWATYRTRAATDPALPDPSTFGSLAEWEETRNNHLSQRCTHY